MLVAVLCCGVFAGAAIYINLVEHPARVGTGIETALAEWAPAYRRGAMMQAPLAIIGGISAIAAWFAGAGPGWLVGGVLLFSVVPFTFLAINPTNNALLARDATRDLSRVAVLLARWNQLHAIRSFLSAIAFVVLTWQLVK
jgi:hypothetical protein